MGMLTGRYWGDRLGGNDRPERLVTFRMPAVASAVEAARQHGIIAAEVISMGRKPRRRVADLMIASIAAANRLPLFTTNPADFHGLESVLTVVPVPVPPSAP